jgi:tripartite-type tricarboxylate transporter receptor subunit TctC
MLFKIKYLRNTICACATLASGAANAQVAEPYPLKAVRFVVGQAPGGGVDLIARAVTAKLTESIGQSMIVDNRTGAAGSIGAGLVAKSAPDGYTLLVVSSSFAINPSLSANLPFDPLKDLAPVILLAEAPFLLVVHPSLPVRSVKELIAFAQARPGALNFASGGNGSSGHLAGELFQSAAHIKIAHVPYKGAGPALTDTIAGQVQLTFTSMLSSLQHVRSARLRALAVTSSRRSAALPELPTVAEAGVRDFATGSWYGVLAPAGTRANVIQRMNSELGKVIALPEMRQKLAADGAEPVGGSPEVFQKYIVTEIAKWARVVKAAGIRIE